MKIYSKAFIYYIQDPTMKNRKCYVGQTRLSLNKRLRSHIKAAKRARKLGKNIHICNWIISLLEQHIDPEIIVLEELENVSQHDLDSAEVWHINSFKNLGIPLANSTIGGQITISDEMANKISNTLKTKYKSGELMHPFKGRHHTQETRDKISKSHKGKQITDKHKQKISIANSGKYHKPHTTETKAILSQQKQGISHPRVKLTSDNVNKIKELLLENKFMIKEIAKLFNIDKTVISKMISGKRWNNYFTDEERLKLKEIQKQNKINRMSGINNPMAKLNSEIVLEIKKAIKSNNYTTKEIATKFNTSPSNVLNIKFGAEWKNITIN